ncbi:hypothetical protein VCUG_01205 [Vavraia culicis subsp. floridensis]|uniref:Uncharacterized protein n=1 Tax=Vavraia culicis (isolate floridensis) TaxID=948595 RepID=L2GUH6_VAVCU|nr:uncharacterized protein VCUG_01205 [Vavraia culicis subsp. floridensis]ELA47321.1 hypothetical protein VCUG_01205 [Vavraia culicis subsp. floridensis]
MINTDDVINTRVYYTHIHGCVRWYFSPLRSITILFVRCFHVINRSHAGQPSYGRQAYTVQNGLSGSCTTSFPPTIPSLTNIRTYYLIRINTLINRFCRLRSAYSIPKTPYCPNRHDHITRYLSAQKKVLITPCRSIEAFIQLNSFNLAAMSDETFFTTS